MEEVIFPTLAKAVPVPDVWKAGVIDESTRGVILNITIENIRTALKGPFRIPMLVDKLLTLLVDDIQGHSDDVSQGVYTQERAKVMLHLKGGYCFMYVF